MFSLLILHSKVAFFFTKQREFMRLQTLELFMFMNIDLYLIV